MRPSSAALHTRQAGLPSVPSLAVRATFGAPSAPGIANSSPPGPRQPPHQGQM